MKFKYHNKGFSLMEVIVAMGVFAIIVGTSLGIFSAIVKAQRQVSLKTKAEREAQLIMEIMVKKIRTSRIDYSYYTSGIVNPVSELALIDINDDRTVFSLDADNKNLILTLNNNVPTIVNSTDVQIDDLKFYIEPPTNPFSGGNFPSKQPKVTIIIKIGSFNIDKYASITVQQTVPQRGGNY